MTGGGVIADDQPFPVQIFQAQSEVIRTIAARESCVIVGRCADYVLRDDPNAVLVNLFVHAPMAARIRRESARTNTTPAEAEKRIRQVDKERAAYYNFFSSKRWGDAQGYDLCVNTGKLEISDVVQARAPLSGAARPALNHRQRRNRQTLRRLPVFPIGEVVCELRVRHRPDVRPSQCGAEGRQARRVSDERVLLLRASGA